MTEYGWRFRYPGEVFEPDRGEVEDAFGLARHIVAEVGRLAAGTA
jgi:hypothetical protein